jgi:hypothetical protein
MRSDGLAPAWAYSCVNLATFFQLPQTMEPSDLPREHSALCGVRAMLVTVFAVGDMDE